MIDILMFTIYFSVLLAFVQILKPWVTQRVLKWYHGKSVITLYYPVLGLIKFFDDGQKDHKDIIYYKREAIRKNPEAKVIVVNVFGTNIYQFCSIELAKQVMMNPKYYKKRETTLFNDLMGEQGLVYTEGNKWLNQRKLLSQHFSFNVLQSRVPLVHEITKSVFQRLPENKRFKLISTCSKVACEVVVRSFFSLNWLDKRINGKDLPDEMCEIMSELTGITYGSVLHMLRSFFGLYKSTMPKFLMTRQEQDLLRRSLDLRMIITEAVKDRIRSYRKEDQSNKDFLKVLLDAHFADPSQETGVTFEEIVHQFITFMFAGTDTTSHFTAMAIYALSLHPEVQERVRQDLENSGVKFQTITPQCLNQSKLLNAFINETLRVYIPTDGFIPRTAVQDHMIGEFKVPKGAQVDITIQPILTHPHYFKDSEKFDIDRWLTDEQNHQAFIPFSGGPRNCIGQHMAQIEAKIMLIYILENFTIQPDPENNVVMTYGFLYEPTDDRLVRLIKRN